MTSFECVSVDYERHGLTYAQHRRTDPRLAARIHAALGDARTVLNVGAGSGSYEPVDRWVLAVEPSATMRAQRPPGAAPAIAARAEALPLDDGAVDAAMACVTIHHWERPETGLAELRRVARGPVCVDGFAEAFWRRPEALLDPAVRGAQSMWSLLEPGVELRIVKRLEAALASGEWDAAHGHLRAQRSFEGSLRLVISEP